MTTRAAVLRGAAALVLACVLLPRLDPTTTAYAGRNFLSPADIAPGEPFNIEDDGSVLLPLPFRFRMCGTWYEEIFVNANGTISFGAPNDDFSETAAEFLAGPPQIAGAWDDLNPTAGGTISFTRTNTEITIDFNGVPEFDSVTGGVGSNTFSIVLERPNRIEVRYGDLTMADGLAGVSCGGMITSGFEAPVDLSERADTWINLLFRPAAFERFLPASPETANDLSHLTLRYTPTTDYFDLAEPNNTLARARRIALPFNSTPVLRFTELATEDDVDFFRFRASAGQVIEAEVLSGQLDTVMGLFDRGTGTLLAVDDDGGSNGLSRIEFTVPADGEYAIAVSTLPDFEFDGGGSGRGRYVLDVRVRAGTGGAPIELLEAPKSASVSRGAW